MTLRANEIGADVYSTDETELDKNNLGVTPEEIEHRVAYPDLSPGRALLDVENGDLYEIMHRVNGITDTVEGLQSESEEYYNWKYRNPEGQDWGGIIQHHYISYAKRQTPTPNAHGEIQTPINRPEENEITDIAPPSFENTVLFDDDDRARPFLLLERPEVTYEEVIPGDTYDVLGWYDPSENDADDRVKPVADIAHDHPSIADVDFDTRTSKELPDTGIHIPWNDVSGTSTVQISASDAKDADYEASVLDRTRDFHITTGSAFDETRFLIDSPFDAKDDIKTINANTRWASDQNRWALTTGQDTLIEMIETFTAAGWTFTVDAEIIDEYATTNVSVEPEREATVTLNEVFEYTFTEEIEVGTGLDIPGVDADIDIKNIDTDFVALDNDGDTITATGVDDRSDNHVESLNDGLIGFDCPRSNAGIVKSLNWKDARYEWNSQNDHWQLNAAVAAELITAFIDNDKSITVPVSILAEIGDETSVTEEQRIDVDGNAVTGVTNYLQKRDQEQDAEINVNEESTTTCQQLHGASPVNPDNLTLMALDMSLADNHDNNGMTVDLGSSTLEEIPQTVKDEWQPATTHDEDTYEWFHPHATKRIRVKETAGWGTEYAVEIQDEYANNFEHVITLADEHMTVMTVITHLKAMTNIE